MKKNSLASSWKSQKCSKNVFLFNVGEHFFHICHHKYFGMRANTLFFYFILNLKQEQVPISIVSKLRRKILKNECAGAICVNKNPSCANYVLVLIMSAAGLTFSGISELLLDFFFTQLDPAHSFFNIFLRNSDTIDIGTCSCI